jgi:hypothetical protein
MAKDLIIKDAAGANVPVNATIGMYRDAAEAGQSLPHYLQTNYPTNAEKDGTAFEQIMEQCGIVVRGNAEFGLRPTLLKDILEPKMEASAITKDGIPASRWIFPAAVLGVIENKLQVDLSMDADAFEGMLALDDSVSNDRWERPVLNFSAPEAARSAPIAQLAMPNSMLSITASDTSYRIPSWGIGLEISEQAARSTTLDLVGLAVARQAAVERNERTQGYVLSLLNGDTDYSMLALSTIAGKVVNAVTLDASLTTAGSLSQKAWIKWLSTNARKRKINYVVTDLNGALSIENRTGRPQSTDNIAGVNRINTTFVVANPRWPSEVKIFITDNASWPANTIMGIDTRYAVHRVKSLTAQYNAIEQFAMKRSTQLRIDSGEMIYRLFDEAYEVLTML